MKFFSSISFIIFISSFFPLNPLKDINDVEIQNITPDSLLPPLNLSVDSSRLTLHWFPPFYRSLNEEWNSLDFSANGWNTNPSIGNWRFDDDLGNMAPCVQFSWTPVRDDYFYSMESRTLSGMGLEKVFLSFDISLNNFSNQTVEQLAVEVFNGNGWIRIDNFSNENGSFYWLSKTYDITEYAIGYLYQIRFLAYGSNSWSINAWYLDNIRIDYLTGSTGDSLLGYNVYLDENLINFITEEEYFYDPSIIEWNHPYSSSVEAVYNTGISDKAFMGWNAGVYLPIPVNFEAEDIGHAAILFWDPPELNTVHTYGNILGYNIYRDGNFIGSVSENTYEYVDQPLASGYYNYRISAIYDFPTQGESVPTNPIELLIHGEFGIGGYFYIRFDSGGYPIPIFDAIVTLTNEFVTYYDTVGFDGSFGFGNDYGGGGDLILKSYCYPDYTVEYVYFHEPPMYMQIPIIGTIAWLEGYVTDISTGCPVEGANISIQCNCSIESNETGYYLTYVDEGDYRVLCEAEGYEAIEDTIFISDTTTWNVALFHPSAIFNPDLDSSLDFLIYPNPAENSIQIECPLNIGAINITNSIGKTIWRHDRIDSHSIKIDLSKLAEGVYFLSFQTEENQLIGKKFLIIR
jgi:hypothetical protein